MHAFTTGIYQTRHGLLVSVSEVKPSGFIIGETLTGIRTMWAPNGRWLDAKHDSQMDLVVKVGKFIEKKL
jgi:hypothetical protein